MIDQTDINRPSSLNCPYCGNEAMPFFRFCTACGLHLEPIASCDNCYNFLGPTWAACAWCGHFSGQDSINRSPNEPISFNRQAFYELRGRTPIDADLDTKDLPKVPEPNPPIDFIPETEGVKVDTFNLELDDDPSSDYLDHSSKGIVSNQISNLFESGSLYSQIGEYEKALESYSDLLELDPRSASAFYARAICYIELSKDKLSLEEKFDDAIKLGLEDFAKAVALDPSYLTAFRKETFYIQLGDRQTGVESYIEQKIEVYRNELKREQEDDITRPRLPYIAQNSTANQSYSEYTSDNDAASSGETAPSSHERSEAISQQNYIPTLSNSSDTAPSEFNFMDTALNAPDDLDDTEASALYNRGEINQRLGEIENAINDYSLAINLNPMFSSAFYARALCQITLGKDDLALEDFANAIKIEPEYLSSLRKEDFYVNIGVRRAEVEEYIAQRNNSRTERWRPFTSPIGIPQSTAEYDVESGHPPLNDIDSKGVLGWVAGLTRKLYRKRS